MASHTFFCVDGHTCGNPVRLVAGGGNAYLSAATGTETTYKVTAQSVTANHSFTIERAANGEVTRKCTPEGKTGSEGGGCQNSTW